MHRWILNDVDDTEVVGARQTQDFSKILHHRIFRPKLIHRQFHLISIVLVGKTQKMRENGETYTAGKSFTLDRMDIFANKFAQSSTTYSW